MVIAVTWPLAGDVVEELAVGVGVSPTVAEHERPEQGQSEDGQDDEHDAVANESAAQGLGLLSSVDRTRGRVRPPPACANAGAGPV